MRHAHHAVHGNPEIDALFADVDRSDSPGAAIGIYRDGETIYQRGYGAADVEHGVPITPSTVFRMASLSKQFTAFTACLAVRAGLLSLDQDIRTYLPQMALRRPVTFRQVMHHLSGMRDEGDLLYLAGWLPQDPRRRDDIVPLLMQQRELNVAPGSRFIYVNSGFTLLAVAVERVTGMAFRDFARQQLFSPLGMTNTCFSAGAGEIVRHRAQSYSMADDGTLRLEHPNIESVGPTGLLSTVADFARWERNLLDPRVGDPDMIAEILTPALLSDHRPTNYGFGFVIGAHRGIRTAEHAGAEAGYRLHFLRVPERRFATAIFANAAWLDPGDLARQVADLILADHVPAAPVVTIAPPGDGNEGVADLAGLSGFYRDHVGGLPCRLMVRAGRLFMLAPGGREYELVGVDGERFRFVDVDVDCLFVRGPDGRAERIVVNWVGQETAVCTRVADEIAPAAAMPEHAGSYASDELDVQYRISLDAGRLVLKRPRFAAEILHAIATDEFSTDGTGLHLRFERGEQGRIAGLLVSTERAWNLRFHRIEPG